jgi:hypothetical protein
MIPSARRIHNNDETFQYLGLWIPEKLKKWHEVQVRLKKLCPFLFPTANGSHDKQSTSWCMLISCWTLCSMDSNHGASPAPWNEGWLFFTIWQFEGFLEWTEFSIWLSCQTLYQERGNQMMVLQYSRYSWRNHQGMIAVDHQEGSTRNGPLPHALQLTHVMDITRIAN